MSISPALGGNTALPSSAQQQQQQYIPYLGAAHVVPVATPYPLANGSGSGSASSHLQESSFVGFPFHPPNQRHNSFSNNSANAGLASTSFATTGSTVSPVQAVAAGQQNTKPGNNKRAIQSCAECKMSLFLFVRPKLWLIKHDLASPQKKDQMYVAHHVRSKSVLTGH